MAIEIISPLNVSLENYIRQMVGMPLQVLENCLLGKNYKKLEIMKDKDIDKLNYDKKVLYRSNVDRAYATGLNLLQTLVKFRNLIIYYHFNNKTYLFNKIINNLAKILKNQVKIMIMK